MALYSARIGESYVLADSAPYDSLLKIIMAFTIRGAAARSIDECDWEHDQLRLNGLSALQLFRDGRAVWTNRERFEKQLAEARSQGYETRFNEANEVNGYLQERLERDLLDRWRVAGYDIVSLRHDMKKLFAELERDAQDRAAQARDGLVDEILAPLFAKSL